MAIVTAIFQKFGSFKSWMVVNKFGRESGRECFEQPLRGRKSLRIIIFCIFYLINAYVFYKSYAVRHQPMTAQHQ
jgi:hypothetical protein